jgi:hypothetical protein
MAFLYVLFVVSVHYLVLHHLKRYHKSSKPACIHCYSKRQAVPLIWFFFLDKEMPRYAPAQGGESTNSLWVVKFFWLM